MAVKQNKKAKSFDKDFDDAPIVQENKLILEQGGVDIEAVYGIDTEGNDLLCILRARAGRGCEDSNIYILQLGDVIYYFIVCQLSWFVLRWPDRKSVV